MPVSMSADITYADAAGIAVVDHTAAIARMIGLTSDDVIVMGSTCIIRSDDLAVHIRRIEYSARLTVHMRWDGASREMGTMVFSLLYFASMTNVPLEILRTMSVEGMSGCYGIGKIPSLMVEAVLDMIRENVQAAR